jgi:hypothetical protein
VGQYDLVVSAAGRVTAVITGVPVVTTAYTTLNNASLPIAPPVSAAQRVAGTVNPADASVRALQTLSGGPTVEVAWANVNVVTGGFEMLLPIGAPVRTAFTSIGPFSLGFTADAAAAGLYSIEAGLDGVFKVQAVDVKSAVPPLSFSFP